MTPEVTCIELAHGILHNIDVDPDNVLDSKHLQPSKWKSGKCRFRKLCEMIDREEDVKHVVRNGQLKFNELFRVSAIMTDLTFIIDIFILIICFYNGFPLYI